MNQEHKHIDTNEHYFTRKQGSTHIYTIQLIQKLVSLFLPVRYKCSMRKQGNEIKSFRIS